MANHSDEQNEGIVQFFVDVIINSAVIIALFFLVQAFIAAPFQVEGNSMYDTLVDNEYIVVSKLEYTFGSPQRGDVIVFHPPHDTEVFYIKRIIGVPGDHVRLKGGEVYVNDVKIEEEYLREGVRTCVVGRLNSCENDDKEYVVPDDEYFVMGDNRHGSSDSRGWMHDGQPDSFVSRDQIQGKTRIVLYPLPSIRLFPETSAFASVH